MKTLNELIKKLNELYNKCIIDIISKEKLSREFLESRILHNQVNSGINNKLQNDSMYSDIPDIKSENKSEDQSEISEDNKHNNSLSFKDDSKYSLKKEYYENNMENCDINIVLSKEDLITLELIDNIKNNLTQISNLDNYGKYDYLKKIANFNPFKEIKEQIILLCKIVGFTKIDDIIYLVTNISNYIFDEEDNDKLSLLNKIFVPLNYKIEKNINITTEINNIKISKYYENHITLFNNQCIIEFAINNILFKINGFIKTDPLNIYIRTSQISNPFLFTYI
jgi:hypothetical protein